MKGVRPTVGCVRSLSAFQSSAADALDAFHRRRSKKCLAEESGRRRGEEARDGGQAGKEEKKAEESGEQSVDAALEGR